MIKKNIKLYLCIFLLTFYLLVNIIAGTTDPSVSDTKYIEYGSKFNYVVELSCVSDTNKIYHGSAVVIKENIALTAAHIVKDCKLHKLKIKDKIYEINKVIVNENFSSNPHKGDIAICFIESPIKLDFYPELYTDSDELDKACSIAGYGLTGTFITGAEKFDSKIRAGSNIIDNIYGDLLVCSVSKEDERKTSLEFLTSVGDSGGGLFIGNKLAGINSCVFSRKDDKSNSSFNKESGHTRISKYREWILKEIEK